MVWTAVGGKGNSGGMDRFGVFLFVVTLRASGLFVGEKGRFPFFFYRCMRLHVRHQSSNNKRWAHESPTPQGSGEERTQLTMLSLVLIVSLAEERSSSTTSDGF